jgi:hypothetical protein
MSKDEIHQMHVYIKPCLVTPFPIHPNAQILTDLSLEGEPPCREVNVLLVLLDGDGGLLLGG